MESLSTELLYAIGELVPRHSLAQLCRASRHCCANFQQLLYRLHGHPDNSDGPSAIFWAVETAHADDAASQALALAVLGKVHAFCRLREGDLDRSYNRRLDNAKLVILGRPNRPPRSISLLTGRAKDWPCRVGKYASFNPLHLAAHKGLDDIVTWLLVHGANANALITDTLHNALVPAVVANQTSTALLLLQHGADQAVDMPYNGINFHNFDITSIPAPPGSGRTRIFIRYKPAITTLAAALGHDALAEKLMDSGFVLTAIPSEMLYVYAQNGHRGSKFVTSLVRRGAEASPRMFQHLVKETSASWATLPLALLEALPTDSPFFSEEWTADTTNKAVITLTTTFQRDLFFSDFHDNHHDRHYYDSDVNMATRALQCLMRFPGVDVNAGGRSLWQQSAYQSLDYGLIKHMLPPFLEAGMDLQCIKKEERKKKENGQEVDLVQETGKKEAPGDLLASTCLFDHVQCQKGAAMQLDVVRLLLKHGALITRATCINALRDHPVGPSVYTTVGRSGWSMKLCNTLLEFCSNVPKEKQRQDMEDFLALYREKTKRLPLINVAFM